LAADSGGSSEVGKKIHSSITKSCSFFMIAQLFN
jgi:hypothetical protein